MAVSGDFNWQYLLLLLLCAFLSVAFLFYFNRLFGSLISWAIRAYVWRQYHVYLHIQALQLSLLGGRCFFKGLRYHGHNETILVNDGYITWRYWLRRVRHADCLSTPSSGPSRVGEEEEQRGTTRLASKSSRNRPPCRIKVMVRGVEWFIYNRTPAYEATHTPQSANGGPEKTEPTPSRRNSSPNCNGTHTSRGQPEIPSSKANDHWAGKNLPGEEKVGESFSASTGDNAREGSPRSPGTSYSLPAFLMLLPVKFECGKAAIVMGNRNTRSVLTAKFDTVIGHIDARPARAIDLYKQIFDFDFGHPIIELRVNHDFHESQLSTGAKKKAGNTRPCSIVDHIQNDKREDSRHSFKAPRIAINGFTQTCKSMFDSIPLIGLNRGQRISSEAPQIPGQDQWLGLTRYLDDEQNVAVEQERWRSIEYGQHPIILDSPSTTMSLYWDVPGRIPVPMKHDDVNGDLRDINGDTPPDWNVELRINGGLLSYGPWADRLRTDLQPVFFPNFYKDAVPTNPLAPGQLRSSTVFKLNIDFEQSTRLMIPTRESSKDWKWKDDGMSQGAGHNEGKGRKGHAKKKKKEDVDTLPTRRPYGWIDVEVQPDSTISFMMDLVAGKGGYKNLLSLDMKQPKMSSSVNHGLLLKAQTAVISCDLPYPLRWNEMRQWTIEIDCAGLEFFMLRDHIFLFTDIISDWTVAAPEDFYTFVAFMYTIKFQIVNFQVHFNANDSNVINDPASMEENTFLTVWGQELNASLQVPLTTFRPPRNQISFEIDAHKGGFKLSRPPWNTQHVFLTTTEVATMKDLKIDGSYNYCTSTSSALTDVLRMNVHGVSPRIRLYGFLVRSFMAIKDNYFGDDIHFRTLEEYQMHITHRDSGSSHNKGTLNQQHHRISNDLDVILSVTAVNIEALLPSYLYSSTSDVALEIASLGLDLRFTNYYMDLDVSFSPISIGHASFPSSDWLDPIEVSEAQAFIDGLGVRGHRLFGLPPSEPTYVCNWDFDVGVITGECSIPFVKDLISALRCFSFTFEDAENALPPVSMVEIHDVTMLRARIQSVHVWLKTHEAALLLDTELCNIEYNDLAGVSFSDRLNVHLASIAVAVVENNSIARDRDSQTLQLQPCVYLETSLELSILHRKPSFLVDRQLQQQHINSHDARTLRTPWLTQREEKSLLLSSKRELGFAAPAMPYPAMPEPLQFSGCSTLIDVSNSNSNLPRVESETCLKVTGPSFRHHGRNTMNHAVGPFKAQRLPYLELHRHFIQSMEYPPSADLHRESRYSSLVETSCTSSVTSGLRANNPCTPSGVSSAYRTPHFRFYQASLDLSEVPSPSENNQARASRDRTCQSGPINTGSEEFPIAQGQCESMSVLVDMAQGLRALFKAQSINVIVSVFEEFQCQDPHGLLDELQVDALQSLPASNQSTQIYQTINETSLKIPYLSLKIVGQFENNQSALTNDISCEFVVTDCAITARERIGSSVSTGNPPHPTLSSHVMLDEAKILVKAVDKKTSRDHAMIQLSLREMNVSGCRAAESSAHVRFEDFEVRCGIAVVHSLTLLAQRVEKWAQDVRRFQIVRERQSARLRLLVLCLVVEGQDLPDPPFLTRASYVLRSASSHVRKSESWKMMSRLRYLYHLLPAQSRSRISSHCTSASPSCRSGARDDVVAIFGRMGLWDNGAASGNILLNKVFGKQVEEETKSLDTLTLKASIKAGGVRFVLQPGSTHSKISFENIALDLDLGQVPTTLGGVLIVERFASIRLYCAETALMVNIHLLELAQDLLRSLPDETRDVPPAPQQTRPDISSTSSYRIHFVLVSDLNTIVVDGSSLRILYICHALSSSVIVGQNASDIRGSTTFLVCTDTARMEILSRSRIVGVGKVDRPSVFGNLDSQKTEADTTCWHLASSCTNLSFQVLEDPLGLLEVANDIVLNEAASIKRLIDSLKEKGQGNQPGRATPSVNALGKPHIALFLDSYIIGYKLLPALSYTVTGKVGRISVRPGLRLSSDVVLDFDLKEHTHAFLGRVGDNTEIISELIIPPINGRLTLGTPSGRTDISLQSTVEHVSLDAAAVHALLASLNRSEIGELVTNVQHELSQLFRRHKPAAPSRKTTSPAVPALQGISFDAYLTLVGLGIHTNTSEDPESHISSQLHFELGHVHLKGNNRGTHEGQPLDHPKLFISLRGLQVELARSVNGQKTPCGDLILGATFQASSKPNERREVVRAYQLHSSRCQMCIYTETASVVMDILGHLQESFRDIDLTNEVKGLQKLRRATLADLGPDVSSKSAEADEEHSTALFSAMYSLEVSNPRIVWKVGDSVPLSLGREAEDLVLSFTKFDLATRRDNAARLLIQDFQLQMVPTSQIATERSLNSALLPEVVFNVAYMSTSTDRRLAFQAAGKSLDLRLTSSFIIPASHLRRSIALAVNRVRGTAKSGVQSPAQSGDQAQKWLRHKRLNSLLVDADFAGAVVYIQGRSIPDHPSSALDVLHGRHIPQQGRYAQFTQDHARSNTTLRAPGVAVKVQYKDPGTGITSLNAEIKVDASANVLDPSVVPLVLQISSSVKEIVGEPGPQSPSAETRLSTSKLIGEERLRAADPSAIFQNCTLNFGLRICKQDFSLSCQPIARVAATAHIDNIYVTVNTVESSDHGQSFSLSGSFTGLQASVKHVHARESTGGFEVQAVVVSLMNSKHIGAANGISVITQISPVKIFVNAKQLQDFLLFREIWVPADIRKPAHAPAPAPAPAPSPSLEPQAYMVQRYQQIASAGAFPWNATLSIAKLDFRVDFGQSLGKSGFIVSDLWASSKKSSDWEQDLCVGVKDVIVESTGRMSGFLNVQGVRVRTTIRWPVIEKAGTQAPLIQASVAVDSAQVKAAFEYQAFAMADMAGFKFLMYNVRDGRTGHTDRLVGVVEINTLRAFCTATSASQGLALYQAFDRLIQEKQAAHQASLKDIEKYLRRRSTTGPQGPGATTGRAKKEVGKQVKETLRLQTKVMVLIGGMDVGVFPSTFVDTQLFRIQALDASAQFAVALEKGRLHSTLELALGQLQVALSGVTKPPMRKSLGDISLEDVVASATNSRGGTILKVPKVVARMQTWQAPGSNDIDFTFRSSFQGKVDVGWNYSRIGVLRGMWNKHVRALAARLGKPLRQSALQITTALDENAKEEGSDAAGKKEKITAVVNVPQSRYQYTPLEPPIIETPQLRDMGEATPPLEWIGLHRERLPNVTHQIVIISLLELAREVDDAYSRILGSS
ncbi:MAG: hypothetical protein Q9182_003402 [Xanthomendoza sp. 2 TL-2023]